MLQEEVYLHLVGVVYLIHFMALCFAGQVMRHALDVGHLEIMSRVSSSHLGFVCNGPC